MKYSDFQGLKLSCLGFGAMRLPQNEDGSIDESQVFKMVAYAAEHGVNYFDTAYPYHGGLSEVVLGKALKQLPRESYYLATKFPGHQIAESYDPADIFEEQLKKCDVEYFDFYLLHNIYENSLPVYKSEQWGIVDYFVEQKRLGRIKHLGFSAHGQLPCIEEFLDLYGDCMEFGQLQVNYLDWTLQKSKEKVELLERHGIPTWVMEPVRGGRLAQLDEASEARLKELRPDASTASWAFRWLQGVPQVKVVLSGMSNMDQMVENIETFSTDAPLSSEEAAVLEGIADGMKNDVPCTACRYCCDACPQQLDIPLFMSLANDVRFSPSFNVGMTIDALEEGKRPQDCVSCWACAALCPQGIEIPDVIAEMVAAQKDVPHWEEMCRQRAAAAAALRGED